DDAALCFAHVVGKTHCIGQTYNMVKRGFTSWEDHHKTAMQVIGRDVDLVGVPLNDLMAAGVPRVDICRDIFVHNTIYSADKLFRDLPEFQPRLTLEEGMAQVIEAMDDNGQISNSDESDWEDRLIEAQRSVGNVSIP
ncbi:MAG: hypothetical protein QF879_19225, partial [Candidatus Latescibacteria bacterium]|nr:hypothetical protein [Candidatus Latescibacterota bacterium]